MVTFKDLGDIVRHAVRLEKKLKDFYDVAEIAVRGSDSKAAISALKARLTEKLTVLEALKPEKFGSLEWMSFVPELREEEVVPKGRITRDSSPAEIFGHIRASEEKLKDFYSRLASRLVSRSPHELFEALVTFKTQQIEEIVRLSQSPGP